jgi:hypothetical protein
VAAILCDENPTGYLTVDGFVLESAAWTILDDLTVLVAPAEWRDGNVVVPHQPGRMAMPVMVDEGEWRFRFVIAGDVDSTGAVYEQGPVAGYLSNLAELRGALDQPSILDSPDSTRAVVYTVPGYGEASGDCHVFLDVTPGLTIGWARDTGRAASMKRAVLTVRCPSGLLTFGGS